MAEDLRFESAFLQQRVSCELAFSSGHDLVSLSRCRAAAADEQEPTSRAPVSHDQQGSNAMSRGFPSMTALLGLLAVAGYQHRDNIAEMLGSIGQSTSGGAGPSGVGGLLGQLSRDHCRGKSYSRGCPANFPTRSINTRRTAGSRWKRTVRVPTPIETPPGRSRPNLDRKGVLLRRRAPAASNEPPNH